MGSASCGDWERAGPVVRLNLSVILQIVESGPVPNLLGGTQIQPPEPVGILRPQRSCRTDGEFFTHPDL
jgi:hypothetical protein